MSASQSAIADRATRSSICLRCTARWTELTISARPNRVTGRQPPRRLLQAQKRAERSSCRYKLRSALGSTYVASALATIGLVEQPAGLGRQGPGHPAPQACVVVDRRASPRRQLVVGLQEDHGSPSIRDDELPLLLEHTADLRESCTEISN